VRYLVAYADLDARTAARARALLPPWETQFARTPAADPQAYWRELMARWDGSDGLVTIEQDIGVHDRVAFQFSDCAEPWCSFGYWLCDLAPFTIMFSGGGCRKVSAGAQRAVPRAVLEAGNAARSSGMCALCRPVCWGHTDAVIAEGLRAAGFEVHRHWPQVAHFGCESTIGGQRFGTVPRLQ
jgi:hypothetical protein